MRRKATVAKAKRRAVPRIRKAAQAEYPSLEELSYEKALAKSVLDREVPMEGDDAVTLAAAMSSLTGSLKRLSYNYGLTVGRSVYKVFEGRKHYRWYGDSIQDIILFFEKLGYDYMLYRILTDNVEVSIYRKNKVNLGCNIHSFDSGVMAGFLAAARGDFVRVSEVSCCNNGAECCKFTTAASLGDPFCTDIKRLSRIMGGARSVGKVRPEYHMLSAEPLMKPQYSSHINSVFFHLGQVASSGFPEGKMSAKMLARSVPVMERFGLGRLEYESKPLKLSILLDGVKAKKEFADISISFLNGMISRYSGRPLRSQLAPGRKGSYKIIVKQ
jgi:predicted hydrocarbon binding protein